jgi:hypothetical protein
MKFQTGLILLALVASVPADAAVTITSSLYGNSSVMPGSSTDFTLFGNPTQFPSGSTGITKNFESGVATQPTILNDFQVFAGADAQYTYGAQNNSSSVNYNAQYGSITTPGDIDGTQKTGIIYSRSSGAQPDLVDFILGGGSTFNYSDFTAYVMIDNAPASGLDDAEVFAALYDPTGAVELSLNGIGVTDEVTTVGSATFLAFHITGGSAGDILQFGALAAAGSGSSAYLSGVSFSDPAPEPSTWAMLGLGLATFAFWQRRRAGASV